MKRVLSLALCVSAMAAILCFPTLSFSQEPPPAQPEKPGATAPATTGQAAPAKAPAAEQDPFAPQPAPPLPPGMTGSDTNDPRAKLKPGLYDAGEIAMAMKHLAFLKKPDAFQLAGTSADDPRVKKALLQLGVGPDQLRENAEVAADGDGATLAFANSDFAFQGKSPVPGKLLWREYLRHRRSGQDIAADVDGMSRGAR